MPKKKLEKKTTPPHSTRILKASDRKRVARGKDMYGYGEQKKKVNFSLTPTAIALISDLAKQLGLSRSETIEQLFRNHSESLVTLFKQDNHQ